jgi:glycosyltransferase involved in cell wall biosynthesis
MRHLHFTQSLEPLQGGGLGRAALDLHLQLLKDGQTSRLVATRSPHFTRFWPETIQYPRTGLQKAYYARGLDAGAVALMAQADVVHGHGFYVYPNWALGGEAIETHKALVYHPHGMFEPWILNRSRWKKWLVSLLFENRNMRQCRLWRALTTREADQIRQQGFKAPIVVVPNGVRLEDFDTHPKSNGTGVLALPARAAEKRRLVFMARLHPKKGLDLLIPAWAKLKEYHSRWELVIAGPDEDGYRSVVEKMIRDLEVTSATTLIGTVTGYNKRDLLKGADLFILPSHSEGFSVAVLEAMACGTPVIGTHACNFPELESEGGGWLSEATVEAVQEKLADALHGPDVERKQRGAIARHLVEQRYTWHHIAGVINEACLYHCH